MTSKANPTYAKRASQLLAFHHLGLAVRKPEASIALMTAQGYRIGEAIFDPAQNVHAVMCTHATEPAVEILWPGHPPSPIDNLHQRHASGIIYHVCYATDDLAVALSGLAEAGLKVSCVSPPKPAPLFSGRKVSFYNVVGLGLIEILA